ncbi:hypothetical protein CH063_01579 [Colletotrichum higginsianum]|uniref:Uncharacterized protein n=1 Tax=Colletotrichum higginsianum (strain IMI 349063) TaxID=759273 RepID=H1V9E5_COLHI|nr:hypothetical protein CH63R_12243 [Colletotrichum higginsianum IMI 349063]OBR05540.1 hypothetical protein CH63R_12243 [Colletotrichum higginsianum IMI 349063]CCF36848.1 hypothetical protein CH063_01579 [Colletotrichum higginsianum]
MSSPVRSASEPSDEEEHCEPSPESNIRECGYEKWGFVIYRTTYDGSSARPWEDFKDGVLINARSSILKSDAPEILDTMDFFFVEDIALEGASVEDLQRRFRAWVEGEDMVPFEMSDGNDKVYVPRGARHEFFIKVNDVGLRASYVSLVRGFPEVPTEEGREHVKVWHHAIGAELYDELGDPNAAWTGRFYRSVLPTHLVAQGC